MENGRERLYAVHPSHPLAGFDFDEEGRLIK